MTGLPLVLASRSLRRKIILQQMGYRFDIDVSGFDETKVHARSIKNKVMRIACGKAEAVKDRHKDSLILGVDTLVYLNGRSIGQPKNMDEARMVLRMLMGKTHHVYSGICLLNTKTGKCISDFDVSKVQLNKVDDEALESYLKSGKYRGKAGAYNISDPEFKSFVKKVEGSYYNILGMPIEKFQQMMMEAV